jgi:hypothetical protein
MSDFEDEVEIDRPEYYAVKVRLMDCKPGNYEHATGIPATIVTISRSRGDLIEPLVFPISDTRELITKALVALATNHDDFAQKLLDDHFGADDEGHFMWPSEPYELW